MRSLVRNYFYVDAGRMLFNFVRERRVVVQYPTISDPTDYMGVNSVLSLGLWTTTDLLVRL